MEEESGAVLSTALHLGGIHRRSAPASQRFVLEVGHEQIDKPFSQSLSLVFTGDVALCLPALNQRRELQDRAVMAVVVDGLRELWEARTLCDLHPVQRERPGILNDLKRPKAELYQCLGWVVIPEIQLHKRAVQFTTKLADNLTEQTLFAAKALVDISPRSACHRDQRVELNRVETMGQELVRRHLCELVQALLSTRCQPAGLWVRIG